MYNINEPTWTVCTGTVLHLIVTKLSLYCIITQDNNDYYYLISFSYIISLFTFSSTVLHHHNLMRWSHITTSRAHHKYAYTTSTITPQEQHKDTHTHTHTHTPSTSTLTSQTRTHHNHTTSTRTQRENHDHTQPISSFLSRSISEVLTRP